MHSICHSDYEICYSEQLGKVKVPFPLINVLFLNSNIIMKIISKIYSLLIKYKKNKIIYVIAMPKNNSL